MDGRKAKVIHKRMRSQQKETIWALKLVLSPVPCDIDKQQGGAERG